jgi:hypothetical protein
MKEARLHDLTVAELVKRFVTICVEQDKAVFEDEIARYNRLNRQMVAVRDELKARPEDQRSALITLLDHPNLQVRFQAAKSTLAVAPRLKRVSPGTEVIGSEHRAAVISCGRIAVAASHSTACCSVLRAFDRRQHWLLAIGRLAARRVGPAALSVGQ